MSSKRVCLLVFVPNSANQSLAHQVIVHLLRQHIAVGILELLFVQRPVLRLQLVLDLRVHYPSPHPPTPTILRILDLRDVVDQLVIEAAAECLRNDPDPAVIHVMKLLF